MTETSDEFNLVSEELAIALASSSCEVLKEWFNVSQGEVALHK